MALAAWPSLLNMPPEWVAAAVILCARFRLREIAVPPGAGTMEVLAAMAPGLTDSLIRWGTAASRLIARTSSGEGDESPGRGMKRAARPKRTAR